jgi:hypothetical protein
VSALRRQAPAVSTAIVVCFEGRLKPSGSVSHPAAGGRGRAIAVDSKCRAPAPVATVTQGAHAARQPIRRAASSTSAASRADTNLGSASALTQRATAIMPAGRR